MANGRDVREVPWELVPGRLVHGRGIQLSLQDRLRAARGVPQAVVKVTSFCQGTARAGHLLSYISREGALELETDSGEMISGTRQQKALLRDWARDFDGRKKSRDVAHIVYSMPRGSNPEVLRRTMRETLKRSYPDHPAVFAIHEDRAHPHAHAAVHMRSRQRGKKLALRKADLQRMREIFAETAREQGLELAASPRAARGVSDKSRRQPVYHLHGRDEVARFDREMVDQVFEEFQKGLDRPRPWEMAMRRRHAAEKAAYARAAQELREMAAKADTKRAEELEKEASDVEKFGLALPAPKTRRERWAREIQKEIAKRSVPPPPRREAELEMER